VEPLDGKSGWSVQVLHEGKPMLDAPRLMRRREAGRLPFPQPPLEEAEAIAGDAIHKELCTTSDGGKLESAYNNLLDRMNMDKAVERFGRYLFACLFDDTLWTRIHDLAKDAPLELAVNWTRLQGSDPEERAAIARLPWEMMRKEDSFLAMLPGVAITRRVAGCQQAMEEIQSLPRVLFVAGDLDDEVIRPGAEYLGLLRNLAIAGLDLSLNVQLLLKSTAQKIKQAVQWFEPDVVHFICHGGCDSEGTYLYLLDDDKPLLKRPCYGPALIELLGLNEPGRPGGQPKRRKPQIVVLNACSTAAASTEYGSVGQISSPLAAELIEAGVPVVIGMGGEVSDQACRLFTRCFYKALLHGDPIEEATAYGRRAGIIAQGPAHPASSLDWALPIVFFAEGVKETRLKIDKAAVDHARKIQSIASTYSPIDTHPIFCGRLGVFESCNLLVASPETQRALSRNHREFSMLALPVAEADRVDMFQADERYGRTWLLHEIAAQAIRDGHIPVLVSEAILGAKMAKAPAGFLLNIIEAARETARRFGITGWTHQNVQLFSAWKPGDPVPAALGDDLRLFLPGVNDAMNPKCLAMALRYDLLRLRELILPKIVTPGGTPEERQEAESRVKLLLLIDDGHRLGDAAEFLTTNVLAAHGLRGAAAEIRAIVTYAQVPLAGETDAVKKLCEWALKSYVEIQPLEKWKAGEEELVYKTFLLHWRIRNRKAGDPKPLAIDKEASPQMLNLFKAQIKTALNGYPSNIPGPVVGMIVETFREQAGSPLRDADDESALANANKV
jgi:hypothetical protein